MQQKRAGPLYSRLVCGTTVLLVIILVAILRLRGGGPFSPGLLSAANSKNLPLSGYSSHAAFEEQCALCHSPWQGLSAQRCETCHSSVANERLGFNGIHGRLPDAERCEECHSEHLGREEKITLYGLDDFEHAWLTDFDLESHQIGFNRSSIDCEECHTGESYMFSTAACQDCHTNENPIYMSEHAYLYGEDCLACHDGQMTEESFDHDLHFAIDGAHKDLQCGGCHVQPIADGTPNECHQCHQEPQIHVGQFGLDCFRCHETAAWLPAELSYHTFPLDHGGDHENDCQLCHVGRYDNYSCFGCHAHDPEEVRQSHAEERIANLADCISCHPSGLGEEAAVQDSG